MGVVEDQGYWFGFAINTQSIGDDRSVEFSIEIEYLIGEDSPVPPTPTIEARRVEFTPQNSGPIDNAMEQHLENLTGSLSIGDNTNIGNRIREAAGTASTIATIINTQTRFNFNVGSNVRNVRSALPNRVLSVNSMNIGGEDNVPYQNSREVNFPVIKIPEGPGEFFSGDNIPDLIIEAELVLSNSPNLTTTEDIPADFIFEGVSISDLTDCDDLYPNILGDISDLGDRLPSNGDIVERDIGDIGSISLDSLDTTLPVGEAKNTLRNRVEDIPLGDCRREFLDNINELPDVESCADITDFYGGINNRIDSLANEVEDVIERERQLGQGDNVENLRERVRELEIEDVGSGISIEEVRNEINQLRDEVDESERGCLNALESRLNEVDDSIPSIDTPSGPDIDLDCSDIPSLNRRVREFETEVRNRTGSGAVVRSQQAQNLIGQAESLLNDIEGVDDRNPCKSDLRSSVNQAIQDVRGSEPETCTEIYPELENRIDELEARAVSFGAGISEAEIQQTNDLANNLIGRIDDEIDQEDRQCIDQFTERVESSITRLGQEVNTVRVIQAIGEEARQRQQEQVDELEQNLQEIRERVGGIDIR